MSQTVLPDPEVGSRPGGPVDDRRDHPTMMSNQPSQEESNFWDSSGPLFNIYSKAAEEEDKKMVERWQKDADGILIFTGLFSASVAALLAVTVQDLRPNSQDTSAFYLSNIYQVLADSNVTRSSAPFSVAKPTSFSPSRNAVWVNSLWFLSLVMSLSCALWATSLQQWARRYLHRAQPARCSPEKRARMRAFFAEGVDKMHISWAVEGLPTLLHLSLFLFFGGLAIFLFDVNRDVFSYVIWWIGLFSTVYGMITLLPLLRQDSPYNSPLSTPAWFLHAAMTYATVNFFFIVLFCFGVCRSHLFWFCSSRIERVLNPVLTRIFDWEEYYRRRMLGGVEKAVEETASRRSSKIDHQILGWTISALDDDYSLKSFFEAIPGFFNSKLVHHLERDFPVELVEKFQDAFYGFLLRTGTSNSVEYSEKVRRLDISLGALNQVMRKTPDHFILLHILYRLRDDEVSQTVEMGHILAHWLINKDAGTLVVVKHIIAGILVSVRERNESWVTLAAREFGLPEQDLRDNIALGGDNVLLVILLHVTRKYLHSGPHKWMVLEALSKFDIRITLPGLQHDFCTLWNEIVQEATDREPYRISIQEPYNSSPVHILRRIRHLYIASHKGTCAAPTEFSASTETLDRVLLQPSSYPFCDISINHPLPDILSPPPTDGASTASPQPEQVNNNIQLNPAAAPQDIPSAATLSYSSEESEKDSGIVAPSAEPGTLSTAPTNAPVPTLTPISTSIGSFRLTGSAPLPRLRPRGLVNTRNICFANAVLQLLVNSPPFWNLFRELGDLKAQRGAGVFETGGGATPLVDATVRFFKEFLVQEESQLRSPPATGGTSSTDEEKKGNNTVGSFEPTYMYDAMKEKRQLRPLLDGQQQDAEEFLCLYLDALDEELPALLATIRGGQSASATLEVEERELGSQGFVANFVESPITRMFGGKLCSHVRASNKSDIVTTEAWRSLHLDIQCDSIRTIQDTLAHILQPPDVQVGSSGSGNAGRQVPIEALPPVLVLHLNRVRYDVAAGITKIRKSIQLAPELKIPLEPPHYKLYGVLYHHGEFAGSGHYTVDVLHPNGDGDTGEVWLHIDDEAVSVMRHEDVFGELNTDRAAEERCAYLLFYCRTSQIATGS